MISEDRDWGHEQHTGDGASISVAFVLVENFSMISFSSAIEPLHLANRAAGRDLYRCTILSENGQTCTASNGIELTVAGCFGDAQYFDIVVVCGGVGINRHDHRSLQGFLRRSCARGSTIGAVHTGAYVLAQAGLLDGYRATIHWETFSSLVLEHHDIDIKPYLFEIDRKRFTCAGGTATADLMLFLILRDHGSDVASEVADQLVHPHVRNAGDHQRRALRTPDGVSHPKLLRVMELMEGSLSEPIAGPDLAEAVQLSVRQLERLFLKYVGCSPGKYYLGIRLEYAQHLVRQTTMSILSIALESGFSSASHFSKAYLSYFGKPPSDDRKSTTR